MSVQISVRSTTMSYAKDFKQINERCILTHFELESSDIELLDNPQKYILDKGGNVFIALLNGTPVGTCALLAHDALTCELVKMAVEPAAQGCGIGYQLATALIKKATERGFTSVILEGNTRVKASIALFRKLGFKETILNTSTSANGLLTRSNIFMKLDLIPTPLLEYYI